MLNHSPHRFLYLLIALVAFVTLVPVLDELGYGGMIFTIFVSIILLSAVYAVSQSRGQFFLALILAGPAFVLRWINNSLARVGRRCLQRFVLFAGGHAHPDPCLER